MNGNLTVLAAHDVKGVFFFNGHCPDEVRDGLLEMGMTPGFPDEGTEESALDGLRRFCDEMNLAPFETVFVGTETQDLLDARDFGTGFAIYVRNGGSVYESERLADMILETVSQLVFSHGRG